MSPIVYPINFKNRYAQESFFLIECGFKANVLIRFHY